MKQNHDYSLPSKGTSDWHIPLNENFEKIDAGVEIRDVDSNLDQYEPKSDSKYLATDTGTIYLGDGSAWEQFGSIADRKNIVYATDYDGNTLTQRIDVALSDLTGGNGKIIIPPKSDGSAWTWETWNLNPTNHSGIHLEFVGKSSVNYPGTDYAMTIDTGADISSQITDGATFKLTGGQWQATNDPDGFVRLIDTGRAHIAPDMVSGCTNAEGNSTVYSIENNDRWSENNYFSGYIHVCDIGIEFKPSSHKSFVDNRFDNINVGAKQYGAILRGNLGGVEFSNFVFFPRAQDSVGVHIDDWNTDGCHFRSPRFDEVDGGYSNTTAFTSGPDYEPPGPTLYNPRMPTVDTEYRPDSSTGHQLYAIRVKQGSFFIDDIHPRGGTLSLSGDGSVELLDSERNTLFRVDKNGNVTHGGDYRRDDSSPPVFNNNLKTNMEDLRQRDPLFKEIGFHDGSGQYSQSLCFYNGSSWYNIIDQTNM